MGYGNFGGFGGNNMQQMLKKAQAMQANMQKIRQEIDETEYTGSASGNMVEVVFYGNRELKSIKINPQIVDAEDVEMLEDLVSVAIKDAMDKIKTDEQNRLPNLM